MLKPFEPERKMAVSGPLFRDSTPPNLEFRTKKRPGENRVIFPMRYRLFDGTRSCKGRNPRFGYSACGRRA